jgi:predicted TIM-barrel fold metal-dependent hydrolase
MSTPLVIDADTHVFEPLEHFERYLAEPYKHRSPRVFRDQWGIIRVLMEGRLYPDPSITVYEAHEKLQAGGHGHSHAHGQSQSQQHGHGETHQHSQEHGHPHEHGHVHEREHSHEREDPHEHEHASHHDDDQEGGLLEGVAMAMGRPGVTNPEARIKDLDIEGIDVQVILGSLCFAASTLRDPGFALAFCQACNDYVAEFCSSHPDRFKAVGIVPLQDVPSSIAEARRAVKDLGMVGISIPPSLPAKNLDHPDFYPFYQTVQELNVPLGLHWGNGTYLPGAGTERFNKHFLTHVVGHPFEQMIAMASLVCGGILEMFPGVKFGFLESGCGWVPYWMWRLDEEYRGRSLEVPLMKRKPSEYIRGGQCFFSCSPDEWMIATVAEAVGADSIIFSSDYPHADGTFPNSVKTIRERQDLSEDAKRKILGANAARFYNLHDRG